MNPVREAAAAARRWPHGSVLHQEAMGMLRHHYAKYAKLRGESEQQAWNPTLQQLWNWVDGYLVTEEASHGPTPLG